MDLKYGENSLKFKSTESTAQITACLYLWKSSTPIVISDIDGTITKSDALGHVLNLIGRDWTHPGVAKLFQDIYSNGYNIIYLTARSVGQADGTRQYLQGVVQEGIKLPPGPVILSPDRTFAALRREVVLKKPEVFKMACLSDIKNLFFHHIGEEDEDSDQTPFYAGFGNRITDAISYRSVHIPSHRIFTINPDGEVHMELLELAGYKSSYLHIRELVDHFFPPVKEDSSWNTCWDDNQLNDYMKKHGEAADLPSPRCPGSPRSINEEYFRTDERYTDVNFWREPINLDDLPNSDSETDVKQSTPSSPKLTNDKKFDSPRVANAVTPDSITRSRASTIENNISSSFTSPLKNFMTLGKSKSEPPQAKESDGENADDNTHDSDYTDEEVEEDEEDDYTDDDYEDDYDDDEEDEEEEEEDDYEDDYEEDDDELYEDEDEDLEELKERLKESQLGDELNEKHSAEFVKASQIEKN
ncbi:uncharacterized protein SPAPADRAFT_60856, partial [Spathaspora passalidarum NRRL Y-27907]